MRLKKNTPYKFKKDNSFSIFITEVDVSRNKNRLQYKTLVKFWADNNPLHPVLGVVYVGSDMDLYSQEISRMQAKLCEVIYG